MIKQLKSDELYKLKNLATQFTDYIPKLNYNENHFINSLSQFVDSGVGGMFALFEKDDENPIGAIGGIIYPCILTGELVAVELFWYVDKSRQSKNAGIKLINKFEDWAIENNCKRVAMIYLPCSMPESLHKFYEKSGYFLREMHFEKEL